MKQVRFRHEMVSAIPETLQPSTLYVTTDRDVAGHLCACGCGREVITPLSPTDWSISFDRRGASLFPSIGNWAFPCRSHYFIRGGAVVWARGMSDMAIQQGRRQDRVRKQRYYEQHADRPPVYADQVHTSVPPLATSAVGQSISQRLRAWWKRLVG